MSKTLLRFLELLGLFVVVPSLMWARILPHRPLLVLNCAAAICYFMMRSKGMPVFSGGEAKDVIRRFCVLAPVFTIFSFLFLEDRFLSFPRERPLFWLAVCLLYPLFSVVSQEVLFRVWFWERYSASFSSERSLILASSFVFAYVHIVLHNAFAVILSLFGGLLFGFTFSSSRSFFAVWLEHSLWGVLLFTLGWGRYLYHAVH